MFQTTLMLMLSIHVETHTIMDYIRKNLINIFLIPVI